MLTKATESSVAWVLMSGGIDSSACVAFYLERRFCVRGLFIDYGQNAAIREGRAARAIANHYEVPLVEAKWCGTRPKNLGLVLGRNAFLLLAALMEIPDDAGIVALGVHSSTDYPDCSASFVREMQLVFDFYTNGRIQIGAPFVDWTKADVWNFCKSRGLPTYLTYSCERGTEQPCGQCLSCRDVEALNARP